MTADAIMANVATINIIISDCVGIHMVGEVTDEEIVYDPEHVEMRCK